MERAKHIMKRIDYRAEGRSRHGQQLLSALLHPETRTLKTALLRLPAGRCTSQQKYVNIYISKILQATYMLTVNGNIK